MEEAAPLIEKPGKEEKAPTPQKTQAVAVEEVEQGMDREWDGHLLKMCGDCDQAGCSTFAYVKLLTPLAWGHNVQRAFGKGFWRHAILFTLLFSGWTLYFYGNMARGPCDPTHLPHPNPRPDLGPGTFAFEGIGTGGKQLIVGRAVDPETGDFVLDESYDWVNFEDLDLDDASNEVIAAANTEELIQDQIQFAKLEASESLASLGAGRKLLHKHKHDKEQADNKEEKEDLKDHDKYRHHAVQEEQHDYTDTMNPREKIIDGPWHGPGRPSRGCPGDDQFAILGLLVFISSVVGIMYASKMRTAIRKRYGIKGSKCSDCMAWTFCGPCALCQETRTLAKNNVHNGVWYGKTVLPAPTAGPLQAPTPVTTPTKPV